MRIGSVITGELNPTTPCKFVGIDQSPNQNTAGGKGSGLHDTNITVATVGVNPKAVVEATSTSLNLHFDSLVWIRRAG